jgi:hypothetical protein
MPGKWSLFAVTVIAIAVVFAVLVPREAASQRTQACYVGAALWTHDDLRARGDAMATLTFEFWRGERVALQLAPPGAGIAGGDRRWRVEAPAMTSARPNGVRRVTLSYRLDGGDGLLLNRDTWSFIGLRARYYCGDVRESNDQFFVNSRNDAANLPLPSASETMITLTGAGTMAMFESADPDPAQCTSDAQCSDNVVCNGAEVCRPGRVGSDWRGCRMDVPDVACGAGQQCVEPVLSSNALRSGGCVATECLDPDKDGDGVEAISCGGADCNDYAREQWPGNSERWDDQNRDEDCDPYSSSARARFGADQICDGADNVILIPTHGDLRRVACPSGSVCVPQPSGAGVCAGRPEGYVAPARFAYPLTQQNYPGGPPPQLTPAQRRLVRPNQPTPQLPPIRRN